MTDPDGQEAVEEDEGTSLSVWKRLTLFGGLKVAFMLLGLVCLAIGAINAWRAEESLALLVVGLVFVLVALVLAPDWTSIEVAWGNVSAKLLRDISGRLQEVGKEDDPAALRRELEELRSELDSSSKRLARRARPVVTQQPASEDFFRRIFNPSPKATHAFRTDGAVELRLEWASGGAEQVTCQIAPPDGEPITATVDAAPRTPGFNLVRTFAIVYPNEVPGTAAPLPGVYQVRWDRVRPPSGDPIVESFMPFVTPPIATDSFTLR